MQRHRSSARPRPWLTSLLAAALVPLVAAADAPGAPTSRPNGWAATPASWEATRDAAGMHVDAHGCLPPVDPVLADADDALALSLELTRACTDGESIAAVVSEGPEEGALPGWMVPLHDLDGDGSRDVAVVPASQGLLGEQVVDVRSGTTGELLWTRGELGRIAGISRATVGAPDRPGVVVANLVEVTAGVNVAMAQGHVLEVRGVDADGQQQWLHRVVGAHARSVDNAAEVDIAWIAAVADLVGDPTTDVAVARARVVTVLGNPVYLFAVDVLDGRNGEVAGTATIDGTAFPWADLVADVDGDLRAELALNMPDPSAETDVELWRGDGVRLWDVPFPQAFYATTTPVGDLDGDGNIDLVVSGGTFEEGWTIGVRGGDGTKLFTVDSPPFNTVFSPGDLDGDRRVEVGVAGIDLMASLFDPASAMQVHHRLLRADGTTLATEVDAIQVNMQAAMAGFAGGSVMIAIGFGGAGDVDVDGVDDRWFQIAAEVTGAGDPERTGTAGLRRGSDLTLVRELEPFITAPLAATVDGHGADVMVLRDGPDGERQVTVEDGLTGSRIAVADVPTVGLIPVLRGVDLDGRGPDELLAMVFGPDYGVVAAGVLTAPALARAWWLGPSA